jgi:formate hydrogenlyase subunit 6/NADH:ubiquinone oxidoreductase subunit I
LAPHNSTPALCRRRVKINCNQSGTYLFIIFTTSKHVKAFENLTAVALTYLIQRYNFDLILLFSDFSGPYKPFSEYNNKNLSGGFKMPWINKTECTGCYTCVEECPVKTIHMKNEKAEIDMTNCIRCGKCHDVCPVDAVRHDGEKIPDDVEANMARVKDCMNACAEHLGAEEEKRKCLKRFIKYFNKEKKVVEKTLKKLKSLENE